MGFVGQSEFTPVRSARPDGREEDKFACGLANAESQRQAHPPVEILESVQDFGHGVPNAVVVLDVGLPRGAALRQGRPGDPRDDGWLGQEVREAGFFIPTDRWTMLIESSTEVAWIPRRWWSFSVRPLRQAA